MEEAGFAVNGRDCLLIGAGGAARAAVCMMARGKAGSITVLNRSWKRQRSWQSTETEWQAEI